MSEETARYTAIAIAIIEALVWLGALVAMQHATRERQSRAQRAADRFEIGDDDSLGAIVGEAEVAGHPEDLSETLARVLARDGMGPMAPVKIVASSPAEVVFEASGDVHFAAGGFRRGRVRLGPSGAKTRLDYAIEASSGRALLAIGWAFLAAGFVALLVVGWAVFTFAVPSPDPRVRAQAIQMIQAIHLLWPPFLLARLSGQPARFLRGRVDSLLNNLPFA